MNTMLEYLSQNLFLKSLTIGVFASIALTLLGIFVVLKRAIFITLAISEVALLGLVVGIILGINPYLGMFVFTVWVLLFFSFYKTKKGFQEDILIGVVYAVALSLSILFLSKTTFLESHIFNSLSGNILTVNEFEVFLAFFCFLISVLFFILFNRQLFFIFSDKDTALAYGMNYGFLNFLFFLILGINIISFLKSIGVILSFSYLCIPCSFMLTKAKSIKELIIRSVLISLVATVSGIVSSFTIDVPTGPAIVVFLFLYNIILKLFNLA